MSASAVISKVYPTRIQAIEALLAASKGADGKDALWEAADALDRVGPFYGRATTAAIYAAFAQLLRICSLLVQWRRAVLGAEVDADRLLRAAKEQQKLWNREYGEAKPVRALQAIGARVAEVQSIEEATEVCELLAAVPLPVGIFSEDEPSFARNREDQDKGQDETPSELAVAFLQFSVDGKPADHVHHLTPGNVHDLEVEVRVSRWPKGAQQLVLQPVSIEPRSVYEFPEFMLPRPQGDPPFRINAQGRAILKVAQSLQARPFEFRYSAAFEPSSAEQPVAVIGQRTLRIEAVDLSQVSLTGYSGIDQRIVEIRNQIRQLGLISADDIQHALTLLEALGNLAGRSIQDALYRDCSDEPSFQKVLRGDLRRDPRIGAQMEEHPRAAGGITDLSFHGIRLELKYEKQTVLAPADCERFIEQTLSYVVGTGKRLGVLVVLDNSPKGAAPFPAEDGFRVFVRTVGKSSVCVVAILIQGNLARPSDLSR